MITVEALAKFRTTQDDETRSVATSGVDFKFQASSFGFLDLEKTGMQSKIFQK
jgi:hypothetical protein